MRRCAAVLVSALMCLAAGFIGVPSAAATRTTGWASWSPLTTTGNGYAATVQLPVNDFPAARLSTDSQNPRLASGASTFLGGAGNVRPTPPGESYGSSRGQSYVTLGARSSGTAGEPSTSTYTFERPTPTAGWTFVLGDVDADEVHIAAKDAAGDELTAQQIDPWFRGVFNYAGAAARPRWDAQSATLVGAAGFADTDGASGWFEPDVAISALTLTFTARNGIPSYQTWFAAAAQTIDGTVVDVSTAGTPCAVQDSTLTLTGPSGEDLASTHPGADGRYDFGQYAMQPGYTIRLDPPAGCTAAGPSERTVSTENGDADAAFEVHRTTGLTVSGLVHTGPDPVAGVTVTVAPDGAGPSHVVTSGTDGTYLVDGLTAGDYTVTVSDPPAGYVVTPPASRPLTVPPGRDTAGVDFALAELPAVTGSVTGSEAPLGGVTVRLTSVGGAVVTTVTRGDGTYTFEHVPDATYTISVETPDGYRPAPARSGVIVTGGPVSGQDFDLRRPGAVGGSVTVADRPLGGVPVSLSGPGGSRRATTTPDGRFFFDGLDPGRYTVRPIAPAGYRVQGANDAAVTIDSDGDLVDSLQFSLAPVVPPARPAPTPAPPTPAGGGPAGAGLAATGTATVPATLLGLALVTLGSVVLLLARREPRPATIRLTGTDRTG